MKIEVMLSGALEDSGRRARELAATGVDGIFTFEGQHDVFFPLVLAAGGAGRDGHRPRVERGYRVLAQPHAPGQRGVRPPGAHTGPIPPRARVADQAADRATLRFHLVATGGADARDRAGDQGDPRRVGGRGAPRLSRRIHHAHSHDAELRPGPQSLRHAARARRRARATHDRDRGRSGRRHPRDALQQRGGICRSARCPRSPVGSRRAGATRATSRSSVKRSSRWGRPTRRSPRR